MNSSGAKIAKLIGLRAAEISNVWFADLREKWRKKSDQKLRALKKHRKEKKDLLSLLVKNLLDKSPIDKHDFDSLLQRVRTQEYSIFDFFLEVSSLEESIEGVLRCSDEITEAQLLDGMNLVHKKLSGVFGKILKQTSEIYEYIVESEGRGFCQVNTQGNISFANEKMKQLLGLESVTGKRLDSYFKGEEKEFVRKSLSGELGEGPGVRNLQLIADSGKSTPVSAEIAPLLINQHKTGGYACMVDLSQPVKAERVIFDKAPFGITKVNLEEQITYLNRAAFEILGMDKWERRTLRDIFPDEENYNIVKSHFEKRKKGLSDEYKVEITRVNDKKRAPVMISAMPDRDLRGNIIGSLAIVRTRSKESTIEAIHRHIETIREGQELLRAVAEELEGIIPFQLFAAGVYSSDMRHSRSLLNYPSAEEPKWQKRWWEMTPAGRKFINRKKIHFGNFVDLLAQKQWQHLKYDPDFKKLLVDLGFRSFIFYPVVREDRVCASVSLFSKSDNAFDRGHVELLKDLPLSKALVTALYYEENEDLKFRLDLIRKISSASNNIRDAAKVTVNELANHYDWQNISLFRVDEERRVVSLVTQKAHSRTMRFPKDYKQRLDEGLLGYVYENRVGVNVGNVRTDPKFKRIYKATIKGVVSELSLPIILAGKVCWILNIEDSHQNAFSEDEKKALEGVLAEVGEFLQRSWLHHFLNATLESASDAVVVTDSKGNISRVNPATKNLLGHSKKSMIGRAFKDYFRDPDVAQDILKAERPPSKEVSLQGKKGDEINVLLSASQLPEDVGGKVFIAKDLTWHRRMEELEYLEKMYYEIATQTKTPLSLVFTWLGRLRHAITTYAGLDTIDRILKQLRKVELTFDRLALYDKERGVAPPRPFLLSIKEIVDRVREDIPTRDRDKIKVDQEGPPPLVRGDLYQLFFSFQSILSYLLRFLPEEDIIRWRIRREDDRVVSEISGYFPSHTSEKPDDLEEAYLVSRTLAEMAMGKAFIKGFIDQHHGTFFDPRVKDQTMTFRIELPVAQGY